MAWHTTTTGRKYYYQNRWINGRSVRQYIGTGAIGELAALREARRRVQREIQSRVRQEEMATLQAAQDTILEVFRLIDLLFRAGLYAEGYHQHARSTWRRKRVAMFEIAGQSAEPKPQHEGQPTEQEVA